MWRGCRERVESWQRLWGKGRAGEGRGKDRERQDEIGEKVGWTTALGGKARGRQGRGQRLEVGERKCQVKGES